VSFFEVSFFETFPFFADPVFILFLIGCGCFVRIGSLLADWFIESIKLFRQCWKKNRWLRSRRNDSAD
jgi:uncharacterized MAPEG superfamily protein